MFAGALAPYSFKGITGKDHDPKTGLMFYNSRWYDPHTGRFTQSDTFKGALHQPTTQHPYAYVGNNPINRLDPTGHDFLGYDVDGIEYGTDYYGDQTGSWNNFGEFVSGGSNDSGSGGWTPGGIVPGDFDSGGGEYAGDGGYYGGGGYGGGDGGSSGGGESRPPTPEERNQVYSQASQPVSAKYNVQTGTLKQAVSYARLMPATPGTAKYYAASNAISRDKLKQYHTLASAGVFTEALKESSGQPTPQMKAAAFGFTIIVLFGGKIVNAVKENRDTNVEPLWIEDYTPRKTAPGEINRPFDEKVKDILNNPDEWEKTEESEKESTNMRNKGGTSLEEEFINKKTRERIWKHTLKDKYGNPLEEPHFRNYPKQLSV